MTEDRLVYEFETHAPDFLVERGTIRGDYRRGIARMRPWAQWASHLSAEATRFFRGDNGDGLRGLVLMGEAASTPPHDILARWAGMLAAAGLLAYCRRPAPWAEDWEVPPPDDKQVACLHDRAVREAYARDLLQQYLASHSRSREPENWAREMAERHGDERHVPVIVEAEIRLLPYAGLPDRRHEVHARFVIERVDFTTYAFGDGGSFPADPVFTGLWDEVIPTACRP